MTENLRSVPIGELAVSTDPGEVLVAYGIGSCVAICLYDPETQVSGMLHALLPSAPRGKKNPGKPTKFVDQGVPLLVEALQRFGAKPNRLVAHLCGGAQVLSAAGFDGALNIGDRNVRAADAALKTAGLRIKAKAIGGRAGRTVKFYTADGKVTVRSRGQDENVLGGR